MPWMKVKRYKHKRCPRCGTLNDYSASSCCNCGLIFERVTNGSNKLARRLILAGRKDQTVKAPGFPKDVSKKKFLLLSGFLGFFGAHDFYVGRFVKATIELVIGLLTVVLFSLSEVISNFEKVMSFVAVPIGIAVIVWVFDFIDAIFNKYKIPVAADINYDIKNK